MASAPPPLPDLDPVTKLSPYVTRILGQNPGKFTLQGTNSYLVHHPLSPSLLLIDTTGPSSSSPLAPSATSAYTAHLLSALAHHPAQPARVSDVVLTHWHGDHVRALGATLEALATRERAHAGAGAGAEAASPPRVWKMPCAAGDGGGAWASEQGKDAEIEHELERVVHERWVEPAASVDGESEGEGRAPRALRPLVDGQRFSLGAASGTAVDDGNDDNAPVELEVVHTPGHTSDSVCLVLRRSDPSSSGASSSPDAAGSPPLALFTADTVLGHGSSVFASLSAYMASLAALSALLASSSSSSSSSASTADAGSGIKVPLYPGHGAPCDDAAGKVAEYRHHREEREAQVVEALKGRAQDEEAISAGDLTTLIYPPSLPASLHPAATHSLLQHLGKLHEEGRVERVPVAPLIEESGVGEQAGARKAPEGWFDGWRWVGEAETVRASGEAGEETAGRL